MNDLEGQIRVEQQRLYESASLTDEMEDEEAKILLEWGSSQIHKLARTGGRLEDRCKQLRRLMKDINYFIGNAEDMDSDEQLEELERIYNSADELSYPVEEDGMEPLLDELDGASAGDMLEILLAWITHTDLSADGDDEAVPVEVLEEDLTAEALAFDGAEELGLELEDDEEDSADDLFDEETGGSTDTDADTFEETTDDTDTSPY